MKSSGEAKDYDVTKAKQERDDLQAHYDGLFKKKQQVPVFRVLIQCQLFGYFWIRTFFSVKKYRTYLR